MSGAGAAPSWPLRGPASPLASEAKGRQPKFLTRERNVARRTGRPLALIATLQTAQRFSQAPRCKMTVVSGPIGTMLI